jgi:precorrin-2 dehydrogenase / sirohydrochlorin ferrochelatase
LRSDTDRHHYYPLFLDVSGKECLVIGGGAVAERKVMMLLKFNASVHVVSPKVTKKLHHLAESGRIGLTRREYRSGDHAHAAIIFACTDERQTNRLVREDAAARGIPVNVVDRPEECDFIVPSIVKKGDLTIAISTSGVLPMASKKIRQAIESTVTRDWVHYVRIIGAIRRYLLKKVPDKTVRRNIMKCIGSMDMEEVVRTGIPGMKKTVDSRIE